MRGRRGTRNLQHDVLRSLADGTQGWLSIKGNQGSVFLKEADKPFYTIVGAEEAGAEAPSPCNWGEFLGGSVAYQVRLDPDFKVGQGEAIRSLKSGEAGPLDEILRALEPL